MEKNLTIEDKKEIALICEALSSCVRLGIIEMVKKNPEMGRKDIAEKIGVKPSAITFHMNLLINSGIITAESGKGLLGRKSKTSRLNTNKIIINL